MDHLACVERMSIVELLLFGSSSFVMYIHDVYSSGQS